MSPLHYDGPFDNILIFQSRTNAAPATIIIEAGASLSGTSYFPNNHVSLLGDDGHFGSQIIANTATVTGTGTCTIMYDGSYAFCWADIAPDGGDQVVNVIDLLAVINAWGTCGPSCKADVTRDGEVNVNDLLAIINRWGPC